MRQSTLESTTMADAARNHEDATLTMKECEIARHDATVAFTKDDGIWGS